MTASKIVCDSNRTADPPRSHPLMYEHRLTVLAGTSNNPGWLHGYGPITAETVWELAHHSKFWRRLVTDPVNGTVLEVSKRRPSTA